MNVLIINAGQHFAHSGGEFNNTLALQSKQFCRERQLEFEYTHIIEGYDPLVEVDNILWADVIIYHTPIWWFYVPYEFKQYIDTVFSSSHGAFYGSDGRSDNDLQHGYGTGGKLHGKHYLLTTTWNAPQEAFTEPDEFFHERGVDDGVMFGFHRMNAFLGMTPLQSIHFYDVAKMPNLERDIPRYQKHLAEQFARLKPLSSAE